MVCAHYAEVNNIFSCKRIGDGEHCAHEIYRHQKRKIIAQTSEIIKHQFFLSFVFATLSRTGCALNVFVCASVKLSQHSLLAVVCVSCAMRCAFIFNSIEKSL